MRKRVYISTKIGVQRPVGFLSEKNDCIVHALSNATALNYDEAHKIAVAGGRRIGRGAHSALILKKAEELTPFRFVKVVDATAAKIAKILSKPLPVTDGQMTLKAFLRKYPKGNFYAQMRGHAFAVVDGQPIDDIRLREQFMVKQAWRVEI